MKNRLKSLSNEKATKGARDPIAPVPRRQWLRRALRPPRVRAALLITAALLLAPSPSASAADAADEVIAEFDVARGGDPIVVPVSVRGREYPFIVDTGASGWFFDDALRHLLGPAIGRETINAGAFSPNTDLYATPPMRIGPIEVEPDPGVVCAPLREGFGRWGVDFYGAVGVSFLRGKIFEVDFDAGKLRFLRHVPAHPGERFPLDWGDDNDEARALLLELGLLAATRTEWRLPRLELVLPAGGKERFIVDMGGCTMGAGFLRKELFDQLVTAGRMTQVPYSAVEVSTVRGTTVQRTGKLDHLEAGPFCHSGLVFGDAEKNKLGLGYLSRYVVTFDFAQSAIYLRPGKQFQRKERHNLAGIGMVRNEVKTIVDRMDKSGAACKAGLKEGDEILEVDGVPAARTSVFELARMFATPGKRHVRFARQGGGSVRETTVELVDPDDQHQLQGN